ncbi:MAG: RIP metalloprotease RseP [Oscillospiraceae bacterium]|nr:RIP metalloprotease RseP [Oscillospiraceae bacterium]
MEIIITVIASVLIFGLVIFIHESGHFLTAKLSGIKVNEFALGMGPKLISKRKNETLYSLRAFPIGGYVSMEGEDEDSDEIGSFSRAPVSNRILVVAAGAIMNLLLGFIVMFAYTASEEALATRTVGGFYEGSYTEQSGLEAGDTIIAMNGRRMFSADDISYELARVQNASADITVLRGGERVELEDVSFERVEYEDGTSGIRIDFYVLAEEKTFANILKQSFLGAVAMGRQIFLSLFDLITGNVAVNQLAGPVGIVTIISTVSSYGIRPLLSLLALLTINLGIFNLLPLPALDGGRLVFLLFEAVTKKRLNPKYEGIVHLVGFALLIGLMIFVTFNDVSRLFAG